MYGFPIRDCRFFVHYIGKPLLLQPSHYMPAYMIRTILPGHISQVIGNIGVRRPCLIPERGASKAATGSLVDALGFQSLDACIVDDVRGFHV